jgi:hypothetical protein
MNKKSLLTAICSLCLFCACTGWPPRKPSRRVRTELRPLSMDVSRVLAREVALSRLRYVVVHGRRRDLDVLREWMGEPSAEVREAVKKWYRDRHESDPDLDKVVELVELLEAPRRRAMERLERAGDDYKIPWLGAAQK